ncbi:MAG: hypothetical protein AMXMBFR13_42940 [Phycisphaerae bacterium]
MSDGLEPSTNADPTSGQPRRRIWRLLGIRRRPGKWLPIGLTLWGWFVFVCAALVVGGAGFAEYSMQPEFCRSCHIMEPYYQAWHDSTHRGVPCADCHFEPGWRNTLKGKFQATSQVARYVTRTYGSKPHAEVHDSSCLRSGCHERRLLEGKVAWDVVNQRGDNVTIRFDHTPHIQDLRRGKQLRCVSCHSQLVQGQHIVVTLDTCFTCHFKGLRHGRDEEVLGGCRSCHDAPQQQIRLATGMFNHADYLERGVTCENCHSDSVNGDGAVPRQLCWNCHNKPQQLARYGETDFIHRKHVSDHKVECSSCHIQIEHHLTAGIPKHGESVLANSGACGQCHEQTHGGPAELYRGVGGRGVPEMPSPMFRAQVDCIACHQTRSRPDQAADVLGQTFTAAQASCDYCHGTKYSGVLEEWRKSLAALLDQAEVAGEHAREHLSQATLNAEQRLHARRRLDDAEHNIRLVKLGHGVHNVNYATALLNVAIEQCRQITGEPAPASATTRAGP